jgi:hypothetical protein
MPYSSEVLDESGNIFRIEGPYKLNCEESRQFPYIEQFRTWRGQKCCEWPEIPSYMDSIRAQGNLKKNDFWKCGLCQNLCIVATSSNSVGIKSLSGSCDLKIQDKADSIIIMSIDEGSYRFFTNLYRISW